MSVDLGEKNDFRRNWGEHGRKLCNVLLSQTTSHGLQSTAFAFIYIALATLPLATIVLRLILMSLLSYLI